MKKLTLFLSLLTLMFVGLQARAADVYVETDDPTFNVYTWSPEQFGGWPGSVITGFAQLTEVNGKQYYKFTLEGTGRFIIFNKGNTKTANIPLQDGDNFFTYPVNGDYTKYETTNPPIEITSYTIAGEEALMGVNWDPTATQNDMILQEDGTYKLVKEGVELAAKGYEYKVVGNHAWSIWEVPSQGNQTLNIAEAGKYNVTFTLTLGEENVLTAEAELVGEPQPIEITSYTIVGVEALVGAEWNPEFAENDMTVQEDGTYKLVKENVELAAGNYDYKVVGNHAWSIWEVPSQGNQTLNIAEAGKYNVTFTLTLGEENVLTAEAELVGEPQPIEITSYTIVGVEALVGAEWNPEFAENDMTVQEDGTYKLVKENVELAAGNYDYKVVGNHAWRVWEVPSQGNQTLAIEEAGKYNVTFTLSLGEQNVLTALAEKIEEPQPEPDYVLHYGNSSADWQTVTFVADEADSTKFVAANVEFAAGTEFVINHGDDWYGGVAADGENFYLLHYDWCENIPLYTENKVNFRINDAGTYTFVLTVGNDTIKMDVQGFVEPQPIEITSYTIVGVEALVGADWNPEFTDNDMTVQEDGTYKLVKENVELAAGNYDYKVVGNHAWSIWEVPSQGNQTLNIAEAGNYNVTFTLSLGEQNVLTALAEKIEEPQPEPKYLLHYGLNEEGAEWADVEFVADEADSTKFVAANVEFAAGTEFVINHGDDWYGGVVASEEEAFYLIHSEWCDSIPLATEGHKNFRINEAGTYTFVLNVGEEGITMDVQGFSAQGVRGDLDGDGKADVSDVNIVINIILKKDSLADYPGADLDGDNDVDVGDLNILINIMLNKDTTAGNNGQE